MSRFGAAILHLSVSRGDVFIRTAVLFIRVSAVCSDGINVPRDDQAEDLFASPEGSRLQYSRLGHFPIPCREKHEEVHHLTLKQSNQKEEEGKACYHESHVPVPNTVFPALKIFGRVPKLIFVLPKSFIQSFND